MPLCLVANDTLAGTPVVTWTHTYTLSSYTHTYSPLSSNTHTHTLSSLVTHTHTNSPHKHTHTHTLAMALFSGILNILHQQIPHYSCYAACGAQGHEHPWPADLHDPPGCLGLPAPGERACPGHAGTPPPFWSGGMSAIGDWTRKRRGDEKERGLRASAEGRSEEEWRERREEGRRRRGDVTR